MPARRQPSILKRGVATIKTAKKITRALTKKIKAVKKLLPKGQQQSPKARVRRLP